MLKSCFLTLQEILVVEKTQVFRYCEPGGGEGGRERSSSVMWSPIITAGAKPAEGHTNRPWEGKQTARPWGLEKRGWRWGADWTSRKSQRQQASRTQNCSLNLTLREVMGTLGTTDEPKKPGLVPLHTRCWRGTGAQWPGSQALPVQHLLLLSDRGLGWVEPGPGPGGLEATVGTRA